MTLKPITASRFRTLNTSEIQTLRKALENLAATNLSERWAAQSMLDQNMPENFIWVFSEEE